MYFPNSSESGFFLENVALFYKGLSIWGPKYFFYNNNINKISNSGAYLRKITIAMPKSGNIPPPVTSPPQNCLASWETCFGTHFSMNEKFLFFSVDYDILYVESSLQVNLLSSSISCSINQCWHSLLPVCTYLTIYFSRNLWDFILNLYLVLCT